MPHHLSISPRAIHSVSLAALTALALSATATATDTDAAERRALDFMYQSMPLSDRLMYDSTYYRENVRIALRARRELPWGASVPDDVFRHFVLPVRSNNEYLDHFRATYYEELKARVESLAMADAALEVNHWLHEHVTYEPSDARTSAPMATMVTAKGRCGEESVLAVAAMRTVGIPARQVYTPRWAHTDDNHAWVEVWVDGRWHFLGACEPEPELDRAWFNSPVSRGMLMHTRVFGDYRGAEPVLSRKGNITEINVTANYVPLRASTVTVTDAAGNALPGVAVQFKIYNYGEFYTVAQYVTDASGRATMVSGRGDMLAWASDGKRWGFARVSGEATALPLRYAIGERVSADIDIVPPAENPIPSHATAEQVADNARRLAYEDSLRNGYTATFYTSERALAEGYSAAEAALLVKARGNYAQIKSFIAGAAPERRAEAVAMLEAVSDKDLRDTPASVFAATLEAASPHPVDSLYINYVLNPRISNELLTAYRAELPVVGNSASQIMEVVAREISIDEANSYRVPVTPAAAWRHRTADRHSRDILFVALCRTAGIAARIDEVTGKTQYASAAGQWLDVNFEEVTAVVKPKGTLRGTYTPRPYLRDPQYYRHFTISEVDAAGFPALLEFDEYDATMSNTLGIGLTLDAGYYVVTSGTRMADGSVLAHIEALPVEADATAELELTMRRNDADISVIGSIDCEALYERPDGSRASILSTTGRGYFAIAVLGATDEPSNHAVQELQALTEVLNAWGRPLLVLKPGAEPRSELSAITTLHYGIDGDGSIATMLRTATESTKSELPVVAIADSFGRVVFISEGYDTSLAEKIKFVISKL